MTAPPYLAPIVEERSDAVYWAGVFETGYEKLVFSVSDHRVVRESLCRLARKHACRSVIIVGCGLNHSLADALLQHCRSIKHVICTDYPDVIKLAGAHANGAVTHVAWDMTTDFLGARVDCVIAVNSIVSSEDRLNRLRLEKIRNAIRPGGHFLGVFPTVMVDVELDALGRGLDSVYDVRRNAVLERKQNAWQVQYGPILLRQIVRSIFRSEPAIELIFIDPDADTTNYDVYEGGQMPIYELLVECEC